MNALAPLIDEDMISMDLYNEEINKIIRRIAERKCDQYTVIGEHAEIICEDIDGYWVQSWTRVENEEIENELGQ